VLDVLQRDKYLSKDKKQCFMHIWR